MHFGIIKERKNPPDRRVVLSPEACKQLITKYSEAQLTVEPSDIRVYSDAKYTDLGITVSEDIADCDVLLGVKEVPIEALIPNKKYFFFSHTVKKQPYNRKLLQAVLEKNIELYDHEVITGIRGQRLVAFGRYAGIVGAYNGFRALGLKLGLFELPKAETLPNQKALIAALIEIKGLLPKDLKILLTGKGRVGNGVKEMLDAISLTKVSINDYLHHSYEEPVYCQIDVLEYNERLDEQYLGREDFYKHPDEYVSNFMRFAKVTDFYIAGHFFGDGAPYLFTREDAKHTNFNIKVVADVSCDIDGPVACTIKPSTIADPVYGYNAETESEVDFMDKDAIAVMAVDNLPCELPADASDGFGEMFLKYVIPAFFNNDKEGVLERARMTQNGTLTERYKYLEDYVKGKE
ncbi:alanine dehydrogenase [Neptunitalea chrysea]|uniref:Alanine dehydrogenase n=1 Tax=Neptunitalea chrysea TaxID=1647581 RepID=A0A9W6B6N1_9FLAO|nr:NAD(P)-dependent oxidoreductase [Neptunitalea chrysea]GLB53598.1 alanine dehydrogenase [Neptunitalea chrysea]